MKADKVTVVITIKTETLSFDSVFALICEANELIRKETVEGKILKGDGDAIEWSTKKKKIEI